MMRMIGLFMALLVASAYTAAAGPQKGPGDVRKAVRQSALRLPFGAEALPQLQTTRRVRSKQRTTAGAILMTSGAALVGLGISLTTCELEGSDADIYRDAGLSASRDSSGDECELDFRPEYRNREVFATEVPHRYRWHMVGAGLGMLGAGYLLATVWSDVEVSNNISIRARPDGLAVSKRIHW